MTTPNAALAHATLDQIDAHPEIWNQASWCGTAKCFAGWAVELSGERVTSWGEVNGVHVAERAAQLLGFASEAQLDVAGLAATYPNGEPDEDDGGPEWELFSACNTREDLGRLVAEIFGPRPEPVVEMTPPPCADHQVSWLTCDVCTAQRRAFYAALGRGDVS